MARVQKPEVPTGVSLPAQPLRPPRPRSRPARGRSIGSANGMATLFLAVLAVALATPAGAQYFGQNKVQYETHDWSIIKTPNFHVYFHEGERRVALDAARLAERAYERLSTLLRHEIAEPVPIILYASHAEFQQTNISGGLIGEGTGGFTEFLKRRVTLPVTGSYGELDHVLTHELVHAFQIDLLAAGTRGIGASFRWVPPLWVMEGMAEYLSLGHIDELTEMWLRDGALEGYLLPVTVMDRVGDIRVYRYGQAIMAYMGEVFGDEKIGEFFKKAVATRSLERAFEETIGITGERFSENWVEHVRKQYLPVIVDHESPEDFAFRLTNTEEELSNANLSPAISADGNHMVFFSDRSLYNDLYLASAVDGKVEKRLVKGERTADFESLRYFRSSADWSPDNERVCFVALSGGRDAIYVQRVRDGKILHKHKLELDGIANPSFSPDGEWIVFAGVDDGSSNLYRVRTEGGPLEQLTDDRYMVSEPRFSADGTRIVFVTDHGPDTDFDRLLFSKPRIAVYDLTSSGVEVMEGQYGRNVSPHFFPDGQHLLFTSDRTGIFNVFIRDLASGEERQITNILTGVTGIIPTSSAASLSRNGKRLVFSAFSRGSWDLFAMKNPLDLWSESPVWTPPVAEVASDDQAEDAPSMAETAAGAEVVSAEASDDPTAGDPAAPAAVASTEAAVDLPAESPSGVSADASSAGPHGATRDSTATARAEGGTTVVSEGNEDAPQAAAADAPIKPEVVAARLDSLWAQVEEIGGEDFKEFDPKELPLVARTADPADGETLEIDEVFAEKADLPDPSSFEVEPYKTRFSADYVAANGFFAGNVGVGAQSVLRFSDVLGDQIILVGADVYGSFKDSNLLLEYVNLRNRTNWGVSAFQFRNDFFIFAAEADDEFVSQIYRGVQLTLQRPFNRFRRFEISLQGLSVSEEVFRESFFTPEQSVFEAETSGTYYYMQPGIALVTDNTLYGYTGPISGGRSRFAFDVAAGDLKFRTYLGDMRRYLNIRQRYALALRVVGAVSEGRDPQFFRIGGPYTLRGWGFGEFRGTQIGMANVEFRFPLIEQLRLGWPLPLALQGVRGAIFLDLGAAWEDAEAFRPFASSSSGLFRLDDLRGSYGLSTSINLGFSVIKWDLAWRTDLTRTLGKPRGSVSFGLDF